MIGRAPMLAGPWNGLLIVKTRNAQAKWGVMLT